MKEKTGNSIQAFGWYAKAFIPRPPVSIIFGNIFIGSNLLYMYNIYSTLLAYLLALCSDRIRLSCVVVKALWNSVLFVTVTVDLFTLMTMIILIVHVMLTTFPQCNLSLEFSEILRQKHICYHWLSASGISKIVRCEILINKRYYNNDTTLITLYIIEM